MGEERGEVLTLHYSFSKSIKHQKTHGVWFLVLWPHFFFNHDFTFYFSEVASEQIATPLQGMCCSLYLREEKTINGGRRVRVCGPDGYHHLLMEWEDTDQLGTTCWWIKRILTCWVPPVDGVRGYWPVWYHLLMEWENTYQLGTVCWWSERILTSLVPPVDGVRG